MHERRLHSVEGAAAVLRELRARGTRVRRSRNRRQGPRDRRQAHAGAQGKVVAQNNDGILYLFKKNKIAFFHGVGSFTGGSADAGWALRVDGANPADLQAKHVIVATGSKPRALPGVAIDNVRVLDNDGALAMSEVPARLGVVGAGVIGLEMGSVWRRLGAQTTVLEALPAFLGAADEAVAKEAKRVFAKQGLAIQTGVAITRVAVGADAVVVDYTDSAAKPQQATFDRLIVSIGRVPLLPVSTPRPWGCSSMSGASSRWTPNAGPICPASGRSRRRARAHARAQGERRRASPSPSASRASSGHVDFNTVPWVIYTSPEIAWVGQTQPAAEGAGIAYRAAAFRFRRTARAGAGRYDGFRQDSRRR
jgi:dihydrolipoamide dehydrogenase